MALRNFENYIMILTMIRPGLVYPSGKPATRTDYDCDVGRLSSREVDWKSGRQMFIGNLSNLFENNCKKQCTFAKKRDIIYI
tara:strand:- start:336 stop:581 length:246 start_codon:yes stop_codon:yes gene_type:complete